MDIDQKKLTIFSLFEDTLNGILSAESVDGAKGMAAAVLLAWRTLQEEGEDAFRAKVTAIRRDLEEAIKQRTVIQ